MSNTAEIVIRMSQSGQRQVVSAIGGVTRGLGDLKSQVFNLRNLLAGLGIGLLARDLVKAAAEQQRAVMGMETAMRSMGRYTPELSNELQGLASSLQDVTNYGDEATLQGQKFLLTYQDITDDLLPRSSAAMLDLAALMGGDVTAAANMLGKASMGMTGELRRVGITVDETAFKTGGYAGVLAQIEQQVSGQARAMREASGPWIALGNAIGDVKEQGGAIVNEVFGPVGEELIAWVKGIEQTVADFKSSAEFESWADSAADNIIGGFERALIGSAEIVDEFGPIVSRFGAVLDHLWDSYKDLPPWVQEVGLAGALLGGRKGKLLLLGMVEFNRIYADFRGDIEAESLGAQVVSQQRELAELQTQLRKYESGLFANDYLAEKYREKVLWATNNLRRLQGSQGLSLDTSLDSSNGDPAAALLGVAPAEGSAVSYVTRFLDAARAKATELRSGRASAGAGGAAETVMLGLPDVGSFERGLGGNFSLAGDPAAESSPFSLTGPGPLLPGDQIKLDSATELQVQLVDIRGAQIDAEAELQSRITQITQQGALERQIFEQSSWSDRIGIMSGSLIQMTQMAAGNNQAMFRVNQAARVLDAGQEAVRGAIKTWNSYPYPWNVPMTGLHIAGSATYLSQLIGAQPQGGGTPIGYGAGTPASQIATTPINVPVTQQPVEKREQTLVVNVHVMGNVVGNNEFARDIAASIKKASRDGVDFGFKRHDGGLLYS